MNNDVFNTAFHDELDKLAVDVKGFIKRKVAPVALAAGLAGGGYAAGNQSLEPLKATKRSEGPPLAPFTAKRKYIVGGKVQDRPPKYSAERAGRKYQDREATAKKLGLKPKKNELVTEWEKRIEREKHKAAGTSPDLERMLPGGKTAPVKRYFKY